MLSSVSRAENWRGREDGGRRERGREVEREGGRREGDRGG